MTTAFIEKPMNKSVTCAATYNTPAHFTKESENVGKLLTREVQPGFFGNISVTFQVQDGVLRSTETAIRKVDRN